MPTQPMVKSPTPTPAPTQTRARTGRLVERSHRPALFECADAVGPAPARGSRTPTTTRARKAMPMDELAGHRVRTREPRAAVAAAPVSPAARDLLADASLGLGRAVAAGDPADRYAIAHLAALRAAAAVLAARARPTRGRRGSVWTLMTQVAPEFAEWAAFFAAGSAKRQAVQAGLPAGISPREADDLVRQVVAFISLVGESIEHPAGR